MNAARCRLAPVVTLVGLKGRGAPRALEALGEAVPPRPNSWTPLRKPRDGWCLRQGAGEFLLAASEATALAADCERVVGAAASGPPAYVLLRQDRAVILEGPDATDRLLTVCDLDDRLFDRAPDALALVHLAGVSVCLQRERIGADGPVYRIWCDPSYADHVLDTLARHAEHES